MKHGSALAQARRQRPQTVASPTRIWRVFEYRRPLPAAPRFTT